MESLLCEPFLPWYYLDSFVLFFIYLFFLLCKNNGSVVFGFWVRLLVLHGKTLYGMWFLLLVSQCHGSCACSKVGCWLREGALSLQGALSMEGTSSVHLHLGMSPRRLLATTQRHPSTRRQPNPRQLLAQPRKHPCPQCTRIFSSIRDLDRHFLTHTGEKPYECPHCPHRANRKGNLKTHIRALHPDSVMWRSDTVDFV